MQPIVRTYADRRNNGEAAKTWREWLDSSEDSWLGLCFASGAVCAIGVVGAMQITQAACEGMGR